MGLRRGAAACGRAEQLCGAAQWWEAAQGRITGPRMGATLSCAGVQQRAAAQSSCVGRRSGGGGCVGAQRHGAAQGRSVGLRRGAAQG